MSCSQSEHPIRVRIAQVVMNKDTGLYAATLDLTYENKSYTIRIENLIRSPYRARVRFEGDYLIIGLDDNEGKPLSTCCIHSKHIERGCLECKSLLAPPCPERSGEAQ